MSSMSAMVEREKALHLATPMMGGHAFLGPYVRLRIHNCNKRPWPLAYYANLIAVVCTDRDGAKTVVILSECSLN